MAEIFSQVAQEFFVDLDYTCQDLKQEQVEKVIEFISSAPKIFIAAVGHSNLIAQILTMKLNHLGKKAYQVFDIINPPFEAGDLFIVVSQSGETSTLISLARKAKSLGGKILVFTSNPSSSLGSLSNAILEITVKHVEVDFKQLGKIGDVQHGNLSGALFGLALYVVTYTLIILLMELWGENAESIDRRHANLQ